MPNALPWLPGLILKGTSGDVHWRGSALVDYMVDGHAGDNKSEETQKASFSEQIWLTETGWEVLYSATRSTYSFPGSDFSRKTTLLQMNMK